jgi:hypothetical protein
LGAQYLYGILGPEGLRLMTPTVVYIELLSAPLAFLGCYLGNAALVKFAIVMICQLHLGISIALRNAALLSYAACAAWCVFLPIGWEAAASAPIQRPATTTKSKVGFVVSALFVGALAGGNIWFETIGDCSTGSLSSIWSTLLQNRWNVFVGAEE